MINNVMNMTHLLNGKNVATKDQKLEKGTLGFAETFKREQESLRLKTQNPLEKKYASNLSIAKNTETTPIANAVDTKNTSASNSKTSTEVAVKEPSLNAGKKEMSGEAINKEDLEHEDMEELKTVKNDLSHLIELLQGLITIVPEEVEESIGDDLKFQLESMGIEDLSNLKEELNMILSSLSTGIDQNIEPIFEDVHTMLDQLINEVNLLKEEDAPLNEETVRDAMNIMADIQSVIEALPKESASMKNHWEQSANVETKVSVIDKELKIEDSITMENVEINENTSNTKAKNFEKLTTENSDESEDFLNPSTTEDIEFSSNLIQIQQDKVDSKITVPVAKTEILEPKQFINEIGHKAGAFLSKDKNEMHIQLAPEHLGKVSIKIGLNEGTLTGKIYAENFSVKEIIEANLNQLKNALEEQGLNIAGLEVHVGDDSKNFERNLYQSRMGSRQTAKSIGEISSTALAALEQGTEDVNPYLITGQFDGLA